MKDTIQRGSTTDRGLSITVTHVLTIGITTVLIAVLLTGASAMLDTETDRTTEQSLETIGERLAGEVANVDAIADDSSDSGNVSLHSDQPRRVGGSDYTVELLDSDDCGESSVLTSETNCLRLTSDGPDIVQYVPVKIDADVGDDRAAAGGLIVVGYDSDEEEITLRSAN